MIERAIPLSTADATPQGQAPATLKPGKSKLAARDADDRQYFKANPNFDVRVRPPFPSELITCPLSTAVNPKVLVAKRSDGSVFRAVIDQNAVPWPSLDRQFAKPRSVAQAIRYRMVPELVKVAPVLVGWRVR